MLKQKQKKPTSISRGLLLVASLAVLVVGLVSAATQRPSVLAATNSTINFQARLLTAAGNVVPDGVYNVEFKLYAAAENGTALWTETRTDGNKVTVKNGYLTVNLGSVNSFTDENINWDQELWLTMNIGGTGSPAWDGEMDPRLKLTSVPYAFRSGAVVSTDGTGVLTAANGESGTICVRNSASCGFILNQNSSTQTANFRIGGTGQADTSLLSPALDVATAGTLSIGANTATSLAFGSNTNNTAISLQSGTGTIDIGTGAQARTINIGTGGAAQQVTIGSTSAASATTIKGGQGGIRLETNNQDAQVAVHGRTNGTGIFRVLNAAEMPVFNIDTTTSNLISNSSFETVGTSGWFGHGGAAAPVTTIMAHYDNDNALEVTTTGAGQGAKYNYALKPNTQYSFSMFVLPAGPDVPLSPEISTLEIGYSGNGSTDTSCATGQEAWLTSWTRIHCTFTTGSSVSGTTYVYIKQTDAVGRTFYMDAVQLEEAAAITSYRNSTATIGSSLAVNYGPLDAKAANAALIVRALHGGHGLVLKGGGSTSIFNNLLDVQVPDPVLTQSDVSLLRVNEPARSTYIRGGSSFFNSVALDVAAVDDNVNVVKISGRNGGNGTLLHLQGGSSPGANADFIKLQDATNATVFKVDNDGDVTFARSLFIDYASGVTNQLNIQGPSGQFVTVNAANNKFHIGDQADCSGRFCVAQNGSGTGGASYTNSYNSSIFNYSTVSTIINQDIKITDTSSSVNHLIRGIRIDSSASSNASATLNSFQIRIPSTTSASLFAGNAIQVENGSTNIFRITNTGQATFQSLNNTNTAFRILNSGGIAMFTVNTNGTDNGIYIAGTGTNGAGSRVFFGPTGDTGVWIGEDGSSDSNILALNGTSGLNILANNTSVATISSNGAFALQNSTDSNFAFTINGQGATPLMRADTTQRKVAIGAYTSSDINAQLEILPTHTGRAGILISGSAGYNATFLQAQTAGANIFRVSGAGDIVTASGVFATNSASGADSASMSIASGNVTGASASSGVVTVRSGTSNGAGTGGVTIMSGNVTTGSTGGSGSITIDAGSVQAGGTAGSVYIGTTNATSITLGTTSKAQTLTIGSTNGASATTIYSGAGGTTFKSANSATAFRILNGSDVPLFSVDSSNSRVYIGNPTADSTGALLVLDTKNTSGDPTGVAGAMYYNSNSGKFRCYENSTWLNCLSGLNDAVTVESEQPGSVSNSGTANNTAYAAPSQLNGATFVAPPSGKVMLTWAGESQTSGSNWIRLSPEVRTGSTIGSGTVVLAPSDEYCTVQYGVTTARSTGTKLLTGLTPGATYNIRILWKTNTTTGNFMNKQSLQVTPAW